MSAKASGTRQDSAAAPNNAARWGHPLVLAGITAAVVLPQIGAAYGTAVSSAALTTLSGDPDKVLKGMVPIVMSGVLGLYGLLGGLVVRHKASRDAGAAGNGAKYLAAGLTLGVSCVASGYAIGQAGHAGITEYAKNSEYYIPVVLSCIFAEALGLYGAVAAWCIMA